MCIIYLRQIWGGFKQLQLEGELNGVSKSGVLNGIIEPRIIFEKNGRERDLVNCFSFSFISIKDGFEK